MTIQKTNEVIAKNISAFIKSSKTILNQRWPLSTPVCLMLTIFTHKQLWILQILINCQNVLHNFYKEGYIQSKVGSHIITGVPQLISMCVILLSHVSDVSGTQSQNRQSDDFDMFAQSRKSFDQNKENMR